MVQAVGPDILPEQREALEPAHEAIPPPRGLFFIAIRLAVHEMPEGHVLAATGRHEVLAILIRQHCPSADLCRDGVFALGTDAAVVHPARIGIVRTGVDDRDLARLPIGDVDQEGRLAAGVKRLGGLAEIQDALDVHVPGLAVGDGDIPAGPAGHIPRQGIHDLTGETSIAVGEVFRRHDEAEQEDEAAGPDIEEGFTHLEDACRVADHGDAGGHVLDDDRARTERGTAPDRLTRDDRNPAAHEDAVRDLDATRHVAMRAQRRPRADRGIVSDRRVEVEHDEIAQGNVGAGDGAGTKDDATAQLHPLAHEGARMDEGREVRAGGKQGLQQLLLHRRQTQPAEVEFGRVDNVTRQRPDAGEGSERLEGLRIIVEETLEFPGPTAIGMLACPDVEFPAETACADDQEFFHSR